MPANVFKANDWLFAEVGQSRDCKEITIRQLNDGRSFSRSFLRLSALIRKVLRRCVKSRT